MGRSLTAGATDVAGDDVVGAKGFEPPGTTVRIVVPDLISVALAAVA
jgi:hypothetical protein